MNQELQDKLIRHLGFLSQDENNPSLLLEIAILYQQLGDLESAQQYMDKARALGLEEQSDAHVLGLLALSYFDNGEEALAKDTALRALELDPNIYEAKLVIVLTKLITHETTIEEIEALLQIQPQESRLWFALATTYMAQFNLDAAEYTFTEAIRIHPEFYDCYIALAWCYLLKDEIDDAEDAYAEAAHIEGELADAWGGLALIAALKSDFWKMERFLDKANELNPQCFLSEIAEAICYKKKSASKALNLDELPVSQQLALLLEGVQGTSLVH